MSNLLDHLTGGDVAHVVEVLKGRQTEAKPRPGSQAAGSESRLCRLQLHDPGKFELHCVSLVYSICSLQSVTEPSSLGCCEDSVRYLW